MSDVDALDGDLDGGQGALDDLDGDAAVEADEAEPDGNRVVGGVSRAVLEYLARSIVDDAGAVVVEAEQGRGRVTLRLHVAPSDMGRVIGRRGRVAQAIRTVVRAAGAKEGLDADVDIVD